MKQASHPQLIQDFRRGNGVDTGIDPDGTKQIRKHLVNTMNSY